MELLGILFVMCIILVLAGLLFKESELVGDLSLSYDTAMDRVIELEEENKHLKMRVNLAKANSEAISRRHWSEKEIHAETKTMLAESRDDLAKLRAEARRMQDSLSEYKKQNEHLECLLFSAGYEKKGGG